MKLDHSLVGELPVLLPVRSRILKATGNHILGAAQEQRHCKSQDDPKHLRSEPVQSIRWKNICGSHKVEREARN